MPDAREYLLNDGTLGSRVNIPSIRVWGETFNAAWDVGKTFNAPSIQSGPGVWGNI